MEDRFNYLFDNFLKHTNVKTHFSTIHSFFLWVVNRHYNYNEMIESKNAKGQNLVFLKNI